MLFNLHDFFKIGYEISQINTFGYMLMLRVTPNTVINVLNIQ